MQEPLKQIVTNAGEEGSVILAKVEDGKTLMVTMHLQVNLVICSRWVY